MLNITKQAFSEVYDIIYNMGIYNEIPKSFIELINSNRDIEYKVNIDYTQSLNEQELQKGTRVLLSLIYMDYLCSQEERQMLIQKDKNELIKIEEEKREKYNPEILFKKQVKNIEEVKTNEQSIMIYKESILKRLINKIKSIFHVM